jgi:hypothetical protein
MDLLWAAGWPYLVLIDEGPQSDPSGALALFQGALRSLHGRYSRAALWAYHRALVEGLRFEGGVMTRESAALLEDGSPWSDDEVRSLLASSTHFQGASHPGGRLVPWALASMTSASLVADAMISAAERWTDEDMNGYGVDSVAMFHDLGFVLEWLSPTERASALERIAALRERAVASWPFAPHELDSLREQGFHLATFELLVGGEQAALARGHRIEGRLQPSGLDFVGDASIVVDAVNGFATGRWADVHPRAIWLGGEPVLRWYCSNWKRFTGTDVHARFVRVLGQIRSPLVTECMLSMAVESKAKKLARQWFSQRANYARETLPALTKGPHGALASKILDELG